MELLYISSYQFKKNDEKTYALPAYGNAFWQKYLGVFTSVKVLGENVKKYLDNGTMTLLDDPRVEVDIIPSNTHPKDFINDFKIKNILLKRIKAAQAVLIKPSSRKGMMAIEICKKLDKPYMIEVTGDIELTLKNHKNILKRLYAPFLYNQILKSIKDCKFGLYVTRFYLQSKFPIEGTQCGCTDTYIPNPKRDILDKRLEHISEIKNTSKINIGLIASYHDNRKGIDTAIKAMKELNKENVYLHILGLGTENDRNYWYKMAEEYGIKSKLVFDKSLSTTQEVLEWDDTMDIIILPSRSEGLPRCIVEAISRACPCIISNVCGMPELVKDSWLHDPEDYKRLALLLESMLSNRDEMLSAAKDNFLNSFNYTKDVLKERRDNFLTMFLEYCQEQNQI